MERLEGAHVRQIDSLNESLNARHVPESEMHFFNLGSQVQTGENHLKRVKLENILFQVKSTEVYQSRTLKKFF
jgi:hypothetical protein